MADKSVRNLSHIKRFKSNALNKEPNKLLANGSALKGRLI